MTRGFAPWEAFQSLRVRIVTLLSIAILPLGIVAVLQTSAVIKDARALKERDILARTAEAAGTERAFVRHAYGVASGLGAVVAALDGRLTECSAIMERFVAQSNLYIFAGFVSADGMMRCSSGGEAVDFAEAGEWRAFVDDPSPMLSFTPSGAVSGEAVVVASVPVFSPDDGTLLGATSVSVPRRLTDMMFETAQGEKVALALVGRDGDVITASTGEHGLERFNAPDLVPAEMTIPANGLIVEYERDDGVEKLAAIVPLLEDRIYVLGLWRADEQHILVPVLGVAAPLFPLVMWAVTLSVAIFAVDRLILRHLSVLKRRMSRFSLDNPGQGFVTLDHPPSEINAIAETYNRLVDRILGDRAELSQSIEEKELLLREVHHRVKNNLQLIASILNMQLRAVPDGQAKRVLRRVQDRVMSLSSIHKALYEGPSSASVRVDTLLNDVVQTAFTVGLEAGTGVRTSVDLEEVLLDPDEAVPLALLTNELVTNAVKHVGRPETGTPSIKVALSGVGRHVRLWVENTSGPPVQDIVANEGTGLGGRLIEAFCGQLGATKTLVETGGVHSVDIRFTALTPIDEEETGGEDTDGAGSDALPGAEREARAAKAV